MKKIIICIMLLAMLCGCSKEVEPKLIVDGISFEVNITYYNESYFAKGKMEDGQLTLEMKSPSEIEGMVVILDESSAKINYKGLTYEPGKNSLLASASGMLYDSLSIVNRGEGKFESDDKNISLSAGTDNGEFVMSLSPSGFPIDLKYTSGVFYGEFSAVTVL